ncbi:MAG: DegT/DnrJ/EryC1/StrS family aminotransferase [Bacteroidales bacterium]|nr:DegT/DnrJ/EryC1/StrS family aminotransferase [Bacteroidales bacterium]
MKETIFVTKPSLPPLEEFHQYLVEIWNNKRLTNFGPFHRQLEVEMANFLGVDYISLFANGTLALLTAMQTLKTTGEVITTPYSFVATTNSMWWNKIQPVFVDIDPDYCNLNPEKIEAAITPKTTAILPVHVYGNPCNVNQIQEIADIYGLHVIYDAAHTFGIKYKGSSILNHGDLSILSFHATKSFNTMEGGAIICHDAKTKRRIDYLKNFGFANETKVMAPGINSKMNEMQAALGLLQLKYHKENITKRKEIANRYKQELDSCKGLQFLKINPELDDYNFGYLPVFVNDRYGISRDQLYDKLRENNIYGRRYFYPLISEFPNYRGLPSANVENLPIAKEKSEQVLCIPIYPDLSIAEQSEIIEIIKGQCK